MTEILMTGLDPENPDRRMRFSALTESWRLSGVVPDEAQIRAANAAIPAAFDDCYRLNCPDGWDSWNEDVSDGRPTDEDWEAAREEFFALVRDVDVYSPDGPDMRPAFARGLVFESVKDEIPGYREWEAEVEAAYDARMRASGSVPPAFRDEWLREHPVDEFREVVGERRESSSPELGLGGMCLSRTVEREGASASRERAAVFDASRNRERPVPGSRSALDEVSRGARALEDASRASEMEDDRGVV